MFITKTLTKKNLEDLIRQSFQFLSFSKASSLADSLKTIGFYYATASGISISIDDLKTPNSKQSLIQSINTDFEEVSKEWSMGLVSDVERFQSVIDNWNLGAETLKNKIIEHFQENDPLNTLYIMAFSGARGNMAQVRQVIGLRGLMVNQDGDVIDLPIKANFREGLTCIDYIVSSYGARKGVVDTALKTADAGYLTRRLIYVAQEVTIKAIDCGTKKGISFALIENSSLKDLFGKSLIKMTDFSNNVIDLPTSLKTIDQDSIPLLEKKKPSVIFYRSAITCKLSQGICQACYGWDLSKNETIDLGSAVGIIAAQSIGEPGTQLTMRTFHTGGIFTGKFLKHQTAPYSGLFTLPEEIKTTLRKNSYGKLVPLLLEDIQGKLISLEGKTIIISIPRNSFLFFPKSGFIKKGQIISELQKSKKLDQDKKIHPVRSPFDGIVLSRKLSVCISKKKTLKLTKHDSLIWLASGKLFETSYGSKFLAKKYLTPNSALAYSKIITPFQGIISFLKDYDTIIIQNKEKKGKLNISQLANLPFSGRVQTIVKNYHYIDSNTVIAYYYYYPSVKEKIYKVKSSIEKKVGNFKDISFSINNKPYFFFYITEKDIWRINFDTHLVFEKNRDIYFPNQTLTPALSLSTSGVLVEKDGFKRIYHKTVGISIPKGTLLGSFQGKFLKKDQILAYLLLSKQKGEDIVQGLPKVEELLEARKTKKSALLFSKPCIFLGSWKTDLSQRLENKKLILNSKNLIYKIDFSPRLSSSLKISGKVKRLPLNKNDRRSVRRLNKKQYFFLRFFHALVPEFKEYIKDNNLYEAIPYNRVDKYIKKNDLSAIKFNSNLIKDIDRYLERINFSSRKLKREFSQNIYPNLETEIITKNFNQSTDANKFEIFGNTRYFLNSIESTYYHLLVQPNKLKIKVSEFVDLGKPLTEGRINPHTLLSSLFHYHFSKTSQVFATSRSIFQFQVILLNSIQSVYRSQGVEIANIHLELILRELTSKVRIQRICKLETNNQKRVKLGTKQLQKGVIQSDKESVDHLSFSRNDSVLFYPTEIISYSLLVSFSDLIEKKNFEKYIQEEKIEKKHLISEKKRKFLYEPILFPISKVPLYKDGFLTASGFQETRFVLTKAAIEGKKDWIKGLKESVIIGRLIPAGTGFTSSANYLDTLFKYKKV